MFALALKRKEGEDAPWRDQAQGNPCKGVERNHEEGHERFFSPAELAALSDALAGLRQTPASDCLRFMMLTGCRPGEAIHATWDQFDDAGFWVKPSAHTKQRKRHRVRSRRPPPNCSSGSGPRGGHAGDAFVFPGQKKGTPLRQIRTAWEAVTAAAGVTDARAYDLRHSFASIGVGGGLSLPIIGRLLGHTKPGTTARYAHLADDPLREAAEKIGAVIAGAGKDGDNVVTLPERSR